MRPLTKPALRHDEGFYKKIKRLNVESGTRFLLLRACKHLGVASHDLPLLRFEDHILNWITLGQIEGEGARAYLT